MCLKYLLLFVARVWLSDGLSCEDESEDMIPREKLAKLGTSPKTTFYF